jgi:hypothetical protein
VGCITRTARMLVFELPRHVRHQVSCTKISILNCPEIRIYTDLHCRDVAYATEHWAYHVCLSEAFPDVINALRGLAFPLPAMSSQQLLDVSDWLKVRHPHARSLSRHNVYLQTRVHDSNGVYDLIGQFAALLRKHNAMSILSEPLCLPQIGRDSNK